MPIAGGWSGRRSGPSTATCSRRSPARSARPPPPPPPRPRLGWRPSVPDPASAPSDQPAASRGHDRQCRNHPARDRVAAGPGTRVLRRRRGTRPAGRPAPREHLGLGGRGARAPSEDCGSSATPSTQPAAASGTSARSMDRGSAAWVPTTAMGARCSHWARRLRRHPIGGLGRTAAALFDRALPAARDLTSPRAEASVVLGCAAILDSAPGGRPAAMLDAPGARDCTTGSGATRRPIGPGRRSSVTYENALLPQALIVAGRVLGFGTDDQLPASTRWTGSSMPRPRPTGTSRRLGTAGGGGVTRCRTSTSSRSRRPRCCSPPKSAHAVTGGARYVAAMERSLRVVPRRQRPRP